MHSPRALLLLVSFLVTAVFTSPTPNVEKRSFTHRVRRSVNTYGESAGRDAMLKAYRKFGFQLIDRAANTTTPSSGNGQTGQVTATPEENDAEYLEKVTIGGQTLTMDFDTGSSDLWVFSTSLSQQTIGQHTVFNPAKSTTFKTLQGSTWSISYGDGSGAAGTVGTDTVNIGGATATGQAVELATAVSQSFVEDTLNDGLVGLAMSSLNTVKPTQQKTFFDTISPQLAQPVFSVNLKNDSTGTYQFGAIDNTAYTGQLTTVPVQAGGFWQVASPTFNVGSTKVENQGGSPAILDTGTSLILVDPAVAQSYYSKVQGAQNDAQAGGYVYPCDAQLPSFGMSIGTTYTATVPGNQITFAQVDQNTCYGGVQSNGGSNLQIYGDVFFRTQYVVFGGGATKQVQIAPKAQGTTTASASNQQQQQVESSKKSSGGSRRMMGGSGTILLVFSAVVSSFFAAIF